MMNRILGLVTAAMFVAALSACDKKGGALSVTRVEPSSGATGGGEQVMIEGSGFEAGKTQVEVRFGNKRCEQVIIASSTQIAVTTPPGARGPVDVSLMFDNGSPFKIPGGFSYVAPAAGGDTRKAFFSGQAKKQ